MWDLADLDGDTVPELRSKAAAESAAILSFLQKSETIP